MRHPATLITSLVTLAVVASGPIATASAKDPAANRKLSQATAAACIQSPSSDTCRTDALADINAAHAAEGVPAITLPGDFTSLSVPEQLLALTDLERTSRGLPPVIGLAAPLDRNAARAAGRGEDPEPSDFYGTSWSANWAGGYPSSLEADFAWMYDDGPGSGNIDCTASHKQGCWGHRNDILMNFSPPIVMGAGVASGRYGAEMAELFVGGDKKTGSGKPDQPLSPTWATISHS